MNTPIPSTRLQTIPWRRHIAHSVSVLAATACALSVLCLPQASQAQTNFFFGANQGQNRGWNEAIWHTNQNLLDTALTPTNIYGNTYTTVTNGLVWGNNGAATLNNTVLRNMTNNVNPMTFNGDQLTLNTNCEIRFKNAKDGTPRLMNFPATNGHPGLILNGGILNAGDTSVFTVTGAVQVASWSYLSPCDNGSGGLVNGRAVGIAAVLSGSGTLALIRAPTNVATRISNTNNTFNGQWIVAGGWLFGTVTNSLGTNGILLDPLATTNFLNIDPSITNIIPTPPSVLEVGYDLNSAGSLTLTNGAQMRLHQNCAFTAVTISTANFQSQGSPLTTNLSAGTHFFNDELRTNYPDVFLGVGSGAISVQPYGALPQLQPQFLTQPIPEQIYAGVTAQFSATAVGGGYTWQTNGSNLSDGPTGSGSTVLGSSTNSLIVGNAGIADQDAYTLVVTNRAGSVTSSVASLTIVTPTAEAYETAVRALNPVAYYRLDETVDPATNDSPVFDYAGGFNGTYGNNVQNGNGQYGINGPLPTDPAPNTFPGFSSVNKAARFSNGSTGSRLSVRPWNLNTNAVTITAWINPSATPLPNTGLVYCRGTGAGTVAGLGFGANGLLNYTWNNEQPAFSWNSGLPAPQGQWSFVALVITPTDATIYLLNGTTNIASTHVYTHVVQGFEAGETIGADPFDGGNGTRTFAGTMDDVAIFNSSLSQSQILALYSAASGVTQFPPQIGVEPASTSLYQAQTAHLSGYAVGSQPLSYQWQTYDGAAAYGNLSDNGHFAGSQTPVLTINSIDMPDGTNYVLVVTNLYGSTTSSVATLTVLATNGPEAVTLIGFQQGGQDWDTAGGPPDNGFWSDGNGATLSAAEFPGSTYELLATNVSAANPNTNSARLRTPLNPVVATFPGQILTVHGSGIWANNPNSNFVGNVSEIRLKQPTYGSVQGTVIFPRLVMNGGQLDAGNDGMCIIGGEMDILKNAPMYSDSANDRGFRIDALLTGSAGIELHGYNSGFNAGHTNNLNITGTNNTFSGPWNVVVGVLLGTGTNALGTNSITVGNDGALETTYDIHSSNATLVVVGNGRVFLHQNDTFGSVIIGGVGLGAGTYSFASLNASYPTNFPAIWTNQVGSAFSTGSGSLTVLGVAPPIFIVQPGPPTQSFYPGQQASVQFSGIAVGGLPLTYQWQAGVTNSGVFTNLAEAGNVSGTTTTNLTITTPTPDNTADYRVVVTNTGGSATSLVAQLVVLTPGAAENITMSVSQATGNDWDTAADWSNTQAASLSVFSNPGSTFEILAGARMRTPAAPDTSTFPGTAADTLTVDGNGVWANNGSANIGEIRFKHGNASGNPGMVTFNRLIMNGGQLDAGDNGLITIAGEMDILANTPIYVDSAAGHNRPYQISALLTGSASIELHDFTNTLAAPGGLNIAGTANTYSGTWNAVQGTLLGSGAGSLGTNSITIATNGALETTYDLNNPAANLIVNGRLFLHQNDTFRTATYGGNDPTPGLALAPGTYTAAQLTALSAANFPASWPLQTGSSVSTASGSLTVLVGPPAVTLNAEASSGNLTMTWTQGILQSATSVSGPYAPVIGASSPYVIPIDPTQPQVFYRVKVQ